MLRADQAHLLAHHSTEEILADPRFPAARNALLHAMLALYEHEPFLNRLLLEVGRNVLFVVIMCLHARYEEGDRETWPTLRLVKETMATFGLASPRRVADLVSRLIKTGYLAQRFSPLDRRIRLLLPTRKMIAQDKDWLVSHYVPLQVLYPDPGYAAIMQRDPAFQVKHRLAAASLFTLAGQLMARNPVMMQFMRREAGMMILIKLIQLAGPSADRMREISYSDIAGRFGVSRTQVRKLVQEAEKDGLVRLTRRGGQFVQLTTTLIRAFDHFVADTMAGHDLVYNLALRTPANESSQWMRNVPLMAAAASFKQGGAPKTSKNSMT